MKCRIYGTKNIKEYVGIYHDNFINFSIDKDCKLYNYNYFTLNNIEDFTKNSYESYKNCYLLGITSIDRKIKPLEVKTIDIQSLEGLTHIKIKNKDYSIKGVSYNIENNIYEIYTSYKEEEYVNDYDKAKEIYDKIFDTLFEMRKEERLKEYKKEKQEAELYKEKDNKNKLKNWFKRLLNK